MSVGDGTVRTTCAYCGVGCGVLATPRDDGSVEIAGDPGHGANLGRLCVKGAALGETVGLEDRLLHPVLRTPPPAFGRIGSAIEALPLEPDASPVNGGGSHAPSPRLRGDRKSTRLNSSHRLTSRMPSSA
jgi:hypothetical protein